MIWRSIHSLRTRPALAAARSASSNVSASNTRTGPPLSLSGEMRMAHPGP